MKIYGLIGTGVAAVEALAHELEVPHQYIEVGLSKNASYGLEESFFDITPLGQVPCIQYDDGTIMSESGAMMVTMADSFGRNKMVEHGLYIPALADPLRNAYMRWMVFFASGVYYHHLFYAYANRYVSTPAAQAEVRTNSLKELDRLLHFASVQLGKQKYFFGNDCSPFDFYAAMLFGWYPDFKVFANKNPVIKEFCKNIFTRPKSKAIWEKHELLGLVQ